MQGSRSLAVRLLFELCVRTHGRAVTVAEYAALAEVSPTTAWRHAKELQRQYPNDFARMISQRRRWRG